jgi:hypothetical protein
VDYLPFVPIYYLFYPLFFPFCVPMFPIVPNSLFLRYDKVYGEFTIKKGKTG